MEMPYTVNGFNHTLSRRLKEFVGCGFCMFLERVKVYQDILLGTLRSLRLLTLRIRLLLPVEESFRGDPLPLAQDPKIICPEDFEATIVVMIILVVWIAVMLAGYWLYEVIADKLVQDGTRNVEFLH
jgi:hypothetical protein